MNEDIELIRLYDEIDDKEKPTPEVPMLSTLNEEERQDEWWEDGWLRIFTDGSASRPDDWRLATRRSRNLFWTKPST